MTESNSDDDHKAFAGFVDKTLFEFHKTHPDEPITRKEMERECTICWPELDDFQKREFLTFANGHLEEIKKWQCPAEAPKPSQEVPTPNQATKKVKPRKEIKRPDEPVKGTYEPARKQGGPKKKDKSLNEAAKVLDKPVNKPKKIRDKKSPKPNLTAFNHFQKDMFPIIRHQNLDWDLQHISVEIGNRWNAASKKEKQKYQRLAKKDMERFENELEEYQKTGSFTPLDLDGKPLPSAVIDSEKFENSVHFEAAAKLNPHSGPACI